MDVNAPPPPSTLPLTLLVRSTGWLGGAAYVRQLSESVRKSTQLDGRVVSVGSLRQPQVDVHLPAKALRNVGSRATRLIGQGLWRSEQNVHRTDFTIPPARNEIVSILDLAPLHFADEGRVPPHLRDQAQRAIGAIVLTETVAEEVRDELGVMRTWVVPPAVDDRFFGPRPPRPTGPDYVLHVGGASARKGLDDLARAWPQVAALERDVTLVLAGPPHPTGRNALVELTRVAYVGQPSDHEMLTLMAHALTVVVPSHYEGFGMPVAEAMALGTPVVVVNGTSAAEVGGLTAIRAERVDGSDGLAEAVMNGLRARDHRSAQLASGIQHAQRWRTEETRRLQVAAYRDAFSA